MPGRVLVQEETHGVDGVEQHADAAIGDELGGHDVYILVVCGIVSDVFDGGVDEMGGDLEIEMNGVDVFRMVQDA